MAVKKVQYQVSQKGAEKVSGQFGKTDKSLISMAKGVMGAVASMYALKKISDATVGAAIKQEQIFRKLRTSVELAGKSWDSAKGELDGMFASLQATTEYGDTESAEVFTKLMQLTTDYDKSLQGLPMALDLAATGLFDTGTAAKYVAMALAGDVQMLGRYIPELKSTNNEIVKNGTAAEKTAEFMRIFNEKFTGTAQKNLQSTAAQMKQLKNYLGDIGEAIGDEVLPAINLLLGGFINLVKVPLSKKIEEERVEFNSLMRILTDVNTQQDTRNKAIKTLQGQYGAYLGNLDLEAASIEEITKQQKLGNLEYVKKIRLQAAEESLAEASKKLVKAQTDLFNMEVLLGNYIEKNNTRMIGYTKLGIALQKEEVEKLGGKYQKLYDYLVKNNLIMDDAEQKIKGQIDVTEDLEATYKELEAAMQAKFDAGEKEKLFIAWLIEHNYPLAESMGLVNEKIKEQMTDIEALQLISDAQSIIYGENIDFQVMKIDEQAAIYRQMKLDEVAIEEWAAGEKAKILERELFDRNIFFKSVEAGYDQFINTITDAEMTGKKRKEVIWEATKTAFVRFAGDIVKEWIKKQIIKEAVSKGSEAAAIASAGVTATAIASLYATPAALAAAATFGSSAVAGTAAIAASIAATKAMASFAEGTDYITAGKQIIMVGDNPGGRERVQVTPLSSPNINGPQNSNNLTINIYGNFTDVDQFAAEVAERSRLGFNQIQVNA